MTAKLPIDRTTLPPYLLGIISTHGHVVTSPGGEMAKCAGPDWCPACASDLHAVEAWQQNGTGLASVVRRSENTSAPAPDGSDSREGSEVVRKDRFRPASLFLRRLYNFRIVPEILAFADGLQGVLSGWETLQAAAVSDGGGEYEKGVIAGIESTGDAVAALVESLGAATYARNRNAPRPPVLEILTGTGQPIPADVFGFFVGIPADRFTGSVADAMRERVAQIEKWGCQEFDPTTFLAVISEEVGELSESILQTRFGGSKGGLHNVRREAIHVTACGLQMLEALDRSEWLWDMHGPLAAQLDAERTALRDALKMVVGVSDAEGARVLMEWMDKQTPSDSEQENSRRFTIRQALRLLIETGKPDAPARDENARP